MESIIRLSSVLSSPFSAVRYSSSSTSTGRWQRLWMIDILDGKEEFWMKERTAGGGK